MSNELQNRATRNPPYVDDKKPTPEFKLSSSSSEQANNESGPPTSRHEFDAKQQHTAATSTDDMPKSVATSTDNLPHPKQQSENANIIRPRAFGEKDSNESTYSVAEVMKMRHDYKNSPLNNISQPDNDPKSTYEEHKVPDNRHQSRTTEQTSFRNDDIQGKSAKVSERKNESSSIDESDSSNREKESAAGKRSKPDVDTGKSEDSGSVSDDKASQSRNDISTSKKMKATDEKHSSSKTLSDHSSSYDSDSSDNTVRDASTKNSEHKQSKEGVKKTHKESRKESVNSNSSTSSTSTARSTEIKQKSREEVGTKSQSDEKTSSAPNTKDSGETAKKTSEKLSRESVTSTYSTASHRKDSEEIASENEKRSSAPAAKESHQTTTKSPPSISVSKSEDKKSKQSSSGDRTARGEPDVEDEDDQDRKKSKKSVRSKDSKEEKAKISAAGNESESESGEGSEKEKSGDEDEKQDDGKLKVEGLKKGGGSTKSLSKSFKEHHLHIEQLAERFSKSNINVEDPSKCGGLSTNDAKEKLEKDGKNELEKQKEISNLKLFLRQLFTMFNILLIIAAILSLITWTIDRKQMLNLYSACVLITIVVIMSIVTFIEEKKAIAVVQGFTKLLPVKCDVVRDGKRKTIEAFNIVVGDIVLIKRETRVPADIRLLHVKGLKLETSSITGEAEPIESTEDAAASHKDVFDANNVAFNGSFCVDGSGSGVVIRTGKQTIIGQIAELTNSQKEEKTTLEIEINRFVWFVAISSVIMGLIIFVVAGIMTKFQDVLNTFISGFLVIIIANVPQGLPATVSSELTIIARRLAAKNVFVKRLGVVDAFGAVTIIATDKTGTLTQNNMTVTDLWVDKKILKGAPKAKHTDSDKKAHRHELKDYASPVVEMLEVMAVCNEARIEREKKTVDKKGRHKMSSVDTATESLDRICGIDLWHPSGNKTPKNEPGADLETGKKSTNKKIPETQQQSSTKDYKHISGAPSEVALLRYVDSVTSSAQIRRKYKTVFQIQFNSLRKFHLSIVKEVTGNDKEDKKKGGDCEYIVMIKGAPEIVLKKCSTIAIGDKTEKIDKSVQEDFQHAYEQFGNSGRRVIGCAMKKFTAKADADFSKKGNATFPDSKLTFLGIAALMDPPRPDTADAIKTCKTAGIKVFMVTGDHPSTATAIAKEIGLIGEVQSFGHGRKRKDVKLSVAADMDAKFAVVHGQILSTLKDDDWDELLEHNFIVFARTTPEQKLMIVEQCQSRGEIVCVTGDGVNDAPALKKADIGVAMGITGNDVAKQAADIVLMDDNFASIVKGIKEGRLLFDNLRKTIAYTLTHSMPEVVPICFNFILGLPMSLTTLMILSIDLGTEMAPAISLAYEGPEADIMTKPPRKRTTRLVSYAMLLYSYVIAGGMVIIGASLAYLFVYWHHDIALKDLFYSSIDHFKLTGNKNFTSNGHTFSSSQQLDIRTQAAAAYYLTLVMSQVYHLWMCRTRRSSIFKHGFFSNGMAIVAIVIELLLVNLFTYTPGVQYIMGASNPPWQVWFFSLGVGICLWVYNETRKYFIRHWPQHPVVRVFKW